MITEELHIVGSIEITSGKVLVTDPCYIQSGMQIDSLVQVIPMRNGIYTVTVMMDRQDRDRVASINLGQTNGSPYSNGNAAVDSGQMSFMDYSLINDFVNDHTQTGEFRDWANQFTYYGVCNETLTAPHFAGTIGTKIAASSSGWGDGLYPVDVFKDGDNIIGIKVTFLGDEEEDDIYWDDEEEIDEL